MDKIVDALKNLYVALNGDADDVENVSLTADMINEIAALITSGKTAELPAVTAEDNGDVLTVVDGAWAKAALPD